jgi:hypothetical protein
VFTHSRRAHVDESAQFSIIGIESVRSAAITANITAFAAQPRRQQNVHVVVHILIRFPNENPTVAQKERVHKNHGQKIILRLT